MRDAEKLFRQPLTVEFSRVELWEILDQSVIILIVQDKNIYDQWQKYLLTQALWRKCHGKHNLPPGGFALKCGRN